MRFRPADVRPGERRNVLGAFFTLFGLMAGHALLETARDSLFLAKLDSRQLPFVYLGIALLALTISELRQRFRHRAGPGGAPRAPEASGRRGLALLIVAAGLVTLGFWGMLGRSGPWILYAIYLWSGLLSTLLLVRFWTLTGEIFTVVQAKRLFATIGTGSILGAIAGSFGAQQIVGFAEPAQLLPVAAAVFLLAGLAPLLLRPTPAEVAARAAGAAAPAEAAPPAGGDPTASLATGDLGSTFRAIVHHPYLGRVAALVLVSTVAITIGDLVFKSAVARAVEPDELGYVFATFYLVVNVLSLVAQVGIVGWMTRSLGIDRVLSILPLLLLVASGGYLVAALGAGLALAWAFRPVHAALGLRLVDGMLRHSLHRTSMEVLYVPLSGAWRGRVKGFVDVVGQRGGQALASLAFLLLATIGASDLVFGALLVALCALWAWLAIGLKRPYFDVFRSTLDAGTIRTRIDYPDLDLASLETLMSALSSPDDAEVRAAVDLLAEKDRLHLVPALILYHPSASVAVHALDLFEEAERTDHHDHLPRLFARSEPEMRAAVLAAIPFTHPETDAELFDRALADESPDVRATALVGLIAHAEDPDSLHPRVRSILETLLHAGSLEAKASLARAIRRRPSPRFDGVLRSLAATPNPALRREVAIAMRESPNLAFLEALLSMLSQRTCRGEARRTLAALGDPACRRLAAALTDESTPAAIRRHLPRTLSQFDPERVAPVLLARLPVEPEGTVRYKILRALGQLRRRNPSLPLDPAVLDGVIDETFARIFRLIDWRARLVRDSRAHPEWNTPIRDLVHGLLEAKREHAIERIFRLFSLRYPREDFRRIWRGLHGSREEQASSRELLTHALPSPRREATSALFDDVGEERLLAAGEPWYVPPALSRQDLLRDLLEQSSLHLRILVAYHLDELGLPDLREDLKHRRDSALAAMRDSLREAVGPSDDSGEEKAFVVPIR